MNRGQILSNDELKLMRQAGEVAGRILDSLKEVIKPGIRTKEIELFFDRQLAKNPSMEPAFKGFMGYQASCCVSVNEEIIHGIPSDRSIGRSGLVSVDLGIRYEGLFVDTARTYIVGEVSPIARELVRVTHQALHEGIEKVRPGNRIGDIGSSIQDFVESHGFSVIRKFVGHGIGKSLHLPPEVPNYGEKGRGEELIPGQALAVEPMVSAGGFEVKIMDDGWTASTLDGSLSAHFEHTVAVTDKGPWILTA